MNELELKKLYALVKLLEQSNNVTEEEIIEVKKLLKTKQFALAVNRLKELKAKAQQPVKKEEPKVEEDDEYEDFEDVENDEDEDEDEFEEIEEDYEEDYEDDEEYEEDEEEFDDEEAELDEDDGEDSETAKILMAQKKVSDIAFEIPVMKVDPELGKIKKTGVSIVAKQDLMSVYPKELLDINLEQAYIAMLLLDPKAIARYYFLFDDCLFADERMMNIYKWVLFTEGEAYAPEIAKNRFNFAKETPGMAELKEQLKACIGNKKYSFEFIYHQLKKLFIIRKNYVGIPIRDIQEKVVEIVNYRLYNQMTEEEVLSAIEQATVTAKFKKAILNENVTSFLMEGDNKLTNGIALPFPILSSVFKGLRQGETMAYAMPSNAGKSRFTIDIVSYIAFIHRKKVLVISNEMSEEKMKLCLITTILNNPEIQKLHGQKIRKSEGELLEFKFRPDKDKNVEVDSDGFVKRKENESQTNFAKRLEKISDEYRKTMKVTKWLDEQMDNCIFFINITDHTNDELQKVITNYYYKEKIEYIFYDTLKTDTANIGNGEEVKKTATILSNLAQNFNIYIGSSLQLTETKTLPINLDINDLAVSRTVKEVLDTLCLIKQIPNDKLGDYLYSKEEVDTEFMELEKFKDPDVRYYACVVDKNRAGAKPKLLFRLNLAYNEWNELGYLKLKNEDQI